MEKIKMKRKLILWVGLAVLIIILLAAFLIFDHCYTVFNGNVVSRNEEHIVLENTEESDISDITQFNAPVLIDLRSVGASAEDVAFLQEKFPECRILWTVNVSEGFSLENEAEVAVLADSTQLESFVAAADNLGNVKKIKVDYPNLSKRHYDDLAAAFPAAEIEYSVVIKEKEVPIESEKLDFSAFTYEEIIEAAELIEMLPKLSEIELMDAEGNSAFTLDEVIAIHECYPEVKLNYSFELYGQSVSTSTERIEYYKEEIGDEGLELFRKVLPMMHGLKYLRFHECGTSDEAVAQLREDFPEVKIVWLLEFGHVKFYTDTIRLRADFWLTPELVYKLKYCVDVKYIDCGHLYSVSDVEWVRYMPNLEVCIVAISRLKDLTPFEDCKNLEFLEVFSTDVTDLSPLAGCENLEYLNISNLFINDISAIMGLNKLKMVNCNMNRQVPQEQIDEFRRLHPDTIFNYYRNYGPTETGWRFDKSGFYTERYLLLRQQMGYDEVNMSPVGYIPAPIE